MRQFLNGELCEGQGAQMCVRTRPEEHGLRQENDSGRERLAEAEGHACVRYPLSMIRFPVYFYKISTAFFGGCEILKIILKRVRIAKIKRWGVREICPLQRLKHHQNALIKMIWDLCKQRQVE